MALVPTMGALHEGHLALMREARRRAHTVVTSIFVNPTQFAPTDDFARYPRDLQGDLAKCASVGVDLVFAPLDASVLYPAGDETRVLVPLTARHLEGEFRPHHFEGVATICMKLFQLITPEVAVFGRKDYQQLQVIARMVKDLLLPIEVVGLHTIREADGLALSSRNAYLSFSERTRARVIPNGLRAAVDAYEMGERDTDALSRIARTVIERGTTAIDYVTCAHPQSVVPHPRGTTLGEGDHALLAVAARVGNTRLIDNVVLGEERGPLIFATEAP
ncbi:MAG: pantoate--beta-alanine ligase [Polyangiales bacterium]